MADQEHLNQLRCGTYSWNAWRERNPDIKPDLSGEDLSGIKLCPESYCPASNLCTTATANLTGANLSRANLSNAQLAEANFRKADLREAILDGAQLPEADFSRADLSGAKLRGRQTGLYKANFSEARLIRAIFGEAVLSNANFSKANLTEANLLRTDLMDADFSGANLSQANLSGSYFRRTNFSEAVLRSSKLINTQLVETNFEGADLTDCSIYGIAAWGLKLNEKTRQSNLIVTPCDEPTITVDDIEVAQFIYLLLNNKKIRNVIDTVTSKLVLILGRFTDERIQVLNAIRTKLRKHNYLPVLFDFEKAESQSFIETVSTLAHMAKFVIADFTDSKIVLEEVPHIVRNIAVPVQPLFLEGSGREPITLYDLRINHRSILDTYRYRNLDDLLELFEEKVINPAEAKVKELLDLKGKFL